MYKKSPSKIWRKRYNRYQLAGSKFKSGKVYFPPRYVEFETGDTNSELEVISGPAKLVTWSIVYVAPYGFEKNVPYAIAILELENGERITAQLVDIEFDKLQKGDLLYPTFRKFYEDSDRDVIEYGLKWTK